MQIGAMKEDVDVRKFPIYPCDLVREGTETRGGETEYQLILVIVRAPRSSRVEHEGTGSHRREIVNARLDDHMRRETITDKPRDGSFNM
jgi:hypothetical protein